MIECSSHDLKSLVWEVIGVVIEELQICPRTTTRFWGRSACAAGAQKRKAAGIKRQNLLNA